MSQNGLINELVRPEDIKKNVDIIADVTIYGLVICLCTYSHVFQSHTTVFVEFIPFISPTTCFVAGPGGRAV